MNRKNTSKGIKEHNISIPVSGIRPHFELDNKAEDNTKYNKFLKRLTLVRNVLLATSLLVNTYNLVVNENEKAVNDPRIPTIAESDKINVSSYIKGLFSKKEVVRQKDEVIIAVIDNFSEELKFPSSENIIGIKDMGSDLNKNVECEEHGNMVADVVYDRIRNGESKNIKIWPIKINDSNIHKDIPYAITKAVDGGAKVINLSWMVSTENKKYIERWQKAIDYAYENGVIVVQGAGNKEWDERGKYKRPVIFKNVVSVGAVEKRKPNGSYLKAGYSVESTRVDFAAYEPVIKNAKGKYEIITGTSFTTPQVAELMAEIIDQLQTKGIKSTIEQVIEIAKNAADFDIRNDETGWGMISQSKIKKIIESNHIPKGKDVKPPGIDNFKFDDKTFTVSFDLIDENKIDLKSLELYVSGRTYAGANSFSRIDKFEVSNGKVTCILDDLEEGNYSFIIADLKDSVGNIQPPIREVVGVRKLKVDSFVFDEKTSTIMFNLPNKNKIDTSHMNIEISGDTTIGDIYFPKKLKFEEKNGRVVCKLGDLPSGEYDVIVEGLEDYKGNILKSFKKNISVNKSRLEFRTDCRILWPEGRGVDLELTLKSRLSHNVVIVVNDQPIFYGKNEWLPGEGFGGRKRFGGFILADKFKEGVNHITIDIDDGMYKGKVVYEVIVEHGRLHEVKKIREALN